jgi:hypothetical protein
MLLWIPGFPENAFLGSQKKPENAVSGKRFASKNAQKTGGNFAVK